MPSPKATLNLEAWTNFLPQERSNDYEYNLLLYKFKSFFNEVKDYHELHSNCSVSRATADSDQPNHSRNTTKSNINSLGSPPSYNNNNKCPVTANIKTFNGQPVPGTNRSFLPHQNSFPISNGAVKEKEALFAKQTHDQSTVSKQGTSSSVQHYSSSYNLPALANSVHHIPNNNFAKPETTQRGQVLRTRMLLSKSSERLDCVNNNQLANAGLKNRDLEVLQSNNSNTPVARDSKYLQNDANIYDAVSPDDLLADEHDSFNMASSIHNLNRLSLPQKAKLESSKSSLGLGSNASNNNRGVCKPVSSSKSIPMGSTDPDCSNNKSFSSSTILDATNSSSSLSLLTSLPNRDNDFANYVNIDFFLKRNHSPSFDGLEEDGVSNPTSDDSDEDTTNMSNSLSSDQICNESLRNMSPHAIAKKLSNKGNANSSTSITPASSGDFLDEHRSSSMIHVVNPSPPSAKQNDTVSKLASFFSSVGRDSDNPNVRGPKDSANKISPSYQSLRAIHENNTSFVSSSPQTASFETNHIDKDGSALVEAHNTMRSFLSDLNLSPIDDVFEDKAQRRIVKESFAVEFCGRRKLRHLFLFNDAIVCAKYQASSKQKFTFDVKWYLNLNGVSILDLSDVGNQVKYDKEAIENQILAIRTNLTLLRGQLQHIKRSKHKQPSKVIKKLKKKRTELEAELVLLLPHLPLVIKHSNGKKYTFFLSSNFDRNQWIESIKFLQSQLSASKTSSTSPSSSELQAWIQTCRKNLNPSLGTFLLRSNCDDDLLYGDLYVNLSAINGLTKSGRYYFCFEVDSYGHFSQKASSAVLFIENAEHILNEEYIFPLDGTHTLRVLLYEDLGLNAKPSVIGKAHIELSRAWFQDKPIEKIITFSSNCNLITQLSYSSSELLSMRVPHAKLCSTFGMDITQVCKKEKTNVPLLIQLCVNEVERRGMREVGIYRMSGTSTDIQRLKKAFETNPYVAELLLRDIDINSVTGFLKTYLRELPEGLFINKLYLKFVAAFRIPQSDPLGRTKAMLELFHKIPIANQHTIVYLVEHLVKVNKFENYNKMSLTNLATVLGPNILKPPSDSSNANSSDPFTEVVIGSMSQTGILYFFLNRKFSNLPLTELDRSEMTNSSG